jgi:hypothetical protein
MRSPRRDGKLCKARRTVLVFCPISDQTEFWRGTGHCASFAVAERVRRTVIGSLRRECLDHIIALNERQLLRVVRSYADYHNRTRTHLSLGKDPPDTRPIQAPDVGEIVAVPVVGRASSSVRATDGRVKRWWMGFSEGTAIKVDPAD